MAMSTGDASENLTVYRLRWIGYGLLIFALIDVIHILTSVQTSDPTWGLQTIGQFVERVVVPLLGFALVFFGEFYGRRGPEKITLRILSWLCMILAILFFLMAPAVVFQSVSLKGQAEQQASKVVDQRLAQLKQLEDQLNKSNPEQIKALASQLNALGVQVDPKNPAAVKDQIETRIKVFREQLPAQVQGAAASQTSGLLKNAVKWSLGAIVAGVLFLYLWKSSRWA
ncbi:HpsJ-like protein, cyanoexosortase A-associated [Leptodesmis sichuanensis]|uniref:HpsJ-like protein, cyanoexosortase A-associated n=1 Tax=Leptodesmis sichuanensis TaxID=2906798 RepID=UPI001F43FFAD|nr:HpsJ family protein [Leptodesmis sichuanensis]UIE38627.1 HpsJ family protein [Leptodesmis sichuanensis A121]